MDIGNGEFALNINLTDHMGNPIFVIVQTRDTEAPIYKFKELCKVETFLKRINESKGAIDIVQTAEKVLDS